MLESVHTKAAAELRTLPDAVRKDFPLIANARAGVEPGTSLVYLDSAATAQKPRQVIEASVGAYSDSYANVHRSVYRLGEEATLRYEAVRERLRQFLNAISTSEVIFTAGTTDGINLVTHAYGESALASGDEIIVTTLEHHANFVPWQVLAQRKAAKLRVVGLSSDGDIDFEEFKRMLNSRTKIVALTQLANAYGLRLPIEKMIAAAHAVGARVLIDAAQSVAHESIDVQKLNADFLVFSAHKLYGPSGLGVLYAKRALLDQMTPFRTGGNMIERVSIEQTTFAEPPAKFEAGTPNIAGVMAFAAAIDYVSAIGFERIKAHEQALVGEMKAGLNSLGRVRILGEQIDHQALICFTVDGVHPHDLAQYLDHEGICIRAGHHCAQPLLQYLKLPATTRASVGLYNNLLDIERLVVAVKKATEFFGS